MWETIAMKSLLLFDKNNRVGKVTVSIIIAGFLSFFLLIFSVLAGFALFIDSVFGIGREEKDIFYQMKLEVQQEMNIDNNLNTLLLRGVGLQVLTSTEPAPIKAFIVSNFTKEDSVGKKFFKSEEEIYTMLESPPFSFSMEDVQLLKELSSHYIINPIWPVPASQNITSLFGERDDPTGISGGFHYGLDIGASGGMEVVAATTGTVTSSGFDKYLGEYIEIQVENMRYIYAHNRQRLVEKGDTVEAGQPIAKTGSTGNSTGEHLHFEVHKDGEPIDPLPLLQW